ERGTGLFADGEVGARARAQPPGTRAEDNARRGGMPRTPRGTGADEVARIAPARARHDRHRDRGGETRLRGWGRCPPWSPPYSARRPREKVSRTASPSRRQVQSISSSAAI